jgi:hypothetical protein
VSNKDEEEEGEINTKSKRENKRKTIATVTPSKKSTPVIPSPLASVVRRDNGNNNAANANVVTAASSSVAVSPRSAAVIDQKTMNDIYRLVVTNRDTDSLKAQYNSLHAKFDMIIANTKIISDSSIEQSRTMSRFIELMEKQSRPRPENEPQSKKQKK